MIGRKQFYYTNLRNFRSLFILFIQNLFFRKKISKNCSHIKFFKMLSFDILHPSLLLWTHDMRIGKGILINRKDH